MRLARWLVPLALVLVRADVAHAHGPGLLDPEEPYVVDEPTLSAALYGTFDAPDQVFVVRMRLVQRLALPFELLVPHRDELAGHRPAYAIVGPGLPAPSPDLAARLPRALPDGAGAIVDLNDRAERPVVFESFLRRVYLSSGPVAVLLPPGALEIWIWSPGGTRGRFVLGFGVEEGGISVGDVLSHWSDYAYD